MDKRAVSLCQPVSPRSSPGSKGAAVVSPRYCPHLSHVTPQARLLDVGAHIEFTSLRAPAETLYPEAFRQIVPSPRFIISPAITASQDPSPPPDVKHTQNTPVTHYFPTLLCLSSNHFQHLCYLLGLFGSNHL